MNKLVIVVEDGMVQAVYGSVQLSPIDIEVLDMDVQDPDELLVLDERLGTVRQHLQKELHKYECE